MIDKKKIEKTLRYLDKKDYQICKEFLEKSKYEELKEIIDSDIKKFPNEEIGSDAYIALLDLSSELSDYFVPFEELDFYEDEETF